MRTDAARNRDHLLSTAHAMAARGEEPALNELARQAGVGVATVYRHFPDVHTLMLELMAKPLEELRVLLDRAVAKADAGEGLRSLFFEVLELQMTHPMVARLVQSPHPAVAVHVAKLQAAASALVQRARRAKAIRAGITADDVCHLLTGVHAAARDAIDSAAAARRFAEIVLDGLRPRE